MGQKVNPNGLRLGVNRTWDSRWFADADYGDKLLADIEIRKFLNKKLAGAGISRIVIERPAKKASVTIYCARPGVVIGKKGQDIETLKKTNQDIIETLDRVVEIHKNGRIKRQESEKELEALEQELKSKMLEINVKK